ncbi:glycogen synthase GlgA [Defluviimonas sp. WL0075]|uniref:Glycogen synthase n=1 Tax=Albidovulum sediminicola TaxID=2984331 RepID=A0ABT2YY16_9RHOB|nr:glycogen synthase GlgA [Defluviimonas sp. WL0075]MCV2863774.1 glycogen synthase GlgA [Defluviimonas sp. WL0075]
MGKVLSVASECVPLIKTGGLADVVGALPKALAAEGWDMRVLLPAYPGLEARLERAEVIWRDSDLFGGPARVLRGSVGGLEILLLVAPHLFDRAGGLYASGGADHADNPERFAALSWAAAEIARGAGQDGWRPDILHAHDWQGGLAPAYLRYGPPARAKSVLTIHNMAFQGIAPASRLGTLRLPGHAFTSEGLEYYGNLSTLKAGLVTADRITTVSPTYAEELMRPEFGMGLQGVLAARAADLQGILNGVDEAVWSPEADPEITPYSTRSLKGKAVNRQRLLDEFGLEAVEGPLAIVVSRLTDQKGIDLLAGALDGFVQAGGGLALLGAGDPGLEGAMQAAAGRWPGRVGVRIGYDEALAHRMFAGGDAVLVPSRFEPCGLTQMYGLRYGTIPVVAATGGLNDTVIGATPASLAAEAATGITFHPVDGIALSGALRRLVQLHADRRLFEAMRRRAMRAEVGWSGPARAYAALYRNLMS